MEDTRFAFVLSTRISDRARVVSLTHCKSVEEASWVRELGYLANAYAKQRA